jgi:membrane associated rhomboid family serine protease
MGLYERDYTQENFKKQYSSAPQMQFTFPHITPVVKWLLLINIAVYLLKVILFRGEGGEGITPFETLFAVYPVSLLWALELWRLVTYQFLHWDVGHIFVNMLGLFFLGPTLERHWGSKKFLLFYLSCGVAGGLFYLLLVAVKFLEAGPMAGASGSILGMLAACAILFPHFVVFVLFFPIPIRVAAVAFMLLYIASILTGRGNAGGDAAHLAGMVSGAAYVLSGSWREKLRLKLRSNTWQRNIEKNRLLQIELDRILSKVHNSGLHSLTAKEKRILKKATREERRRYQL